MIDLSDLRQFFAQDDGSLPDVFVEGLTQQEITEIYPWILNNASPIGDCGVWDQRLGQSVPLAQFSNPARSFENGEIDSFRQQLELNDLGEVAVPQLSVCVGTCELSFDYRMGADWDDAAIEAFCRFLAKVAEKGAKASIRLSPAMPGTKCASFDKAIALYRTEQLG